jgi:hypothetical protein
MAMTSTEKAKELVDKFKVTLIMSDTDAGEEILCTLIAKECALISVDEILKCHIWKYNSVELYNFWKEVKQEIEKI